jgi:23S rRNA (cytosine1962-C5)-methyltransferase
MQPLITTGWKDYELIDSGGKEKLERFGNFILRRPEPQALWNKSNKEEEWNELANATFIREKIKTKNIADILGRWKLSKSMPNEWEVSIPIDKYYIKIILKLTSSGHIGIFPEQLPNWQFILERVRDHVRNKIRPSVLNLFAYTGAASLAALAAGAEVVHLDSVKQIIHWTEKNRESSGLPKMLHLIVEDAMRFIKRESKRGKKYHGIIMDPPSYGRGPDGEKWVFEQQINDLVNFSSQILDPSTGFFVLNWYSLGFSPFIMMNLVNDYFPGNNAEFGDMIIKSSTGSLLPLGTYLRFTNKI